MTAAALGVIAAIVVYNRLIRAKVAVRQAWAQVDTQLQRRHDLIPNLVATVQGYADHERDALQAVTAARAHALTLRDPVDREVAEDQLTAALGRLFVLSEDYPDLKADANFRTLQTELSETEDRLAFARGFANDRVARYRELTDTLPGLSIARPFRMPRGELFAADGTTEVLEDLDVTFTTERRGIFRDLETRTGFPTMGSYHSFTVDRGDPAEPWNFAEEWWEGGPRIRIGRADQWLTPGTVEVRIDTPGYDGPTTIGPSTLTVQVPGPVQDAACVEGPRRTTEPCATAPVIDGDRATFAFGPFSGREAATVALWFDAAAFDTAAFAPTFYPAPLDRSRGLGPWPLDRAQAALLLVALLLVPIVIWEKLSPWAVYRDRVTDPALHDRQHPRALPAPPFGIRPPEVAGLLLRTQNDDALLLSALVDLDQRGLIDTTATTEFELIHKLLPSGQAATFDGTYDATVASRVSASKKALSGRASTVFDTHGFKRDQGGLLARTWFRVLFVVGYLGVAAALVAVFVWATPLHPVTAGIIVALVLLGWGSRSGCGGITGCRSTQRAATPSRRPAPSRGSCARWRASSSTGRPARPASTITTRR